MEAPLSSPSLNGSSKTNPSYFAASSASTQKATTSAPQMQQPPPAQKPNDTTSPFLRDFNLVAEAAKRAQMAVLMRDFESTAI